MKIKAEKILTPWNFLIGCLLLLAFIVRIYRIDELLGFYFDQGRDALVIWKLLNEGKFFLIGPTTGIEGVFRGPWYYWLITPFYFFGRGSPIWPSVFLSSTTVFAVFLCFRLAEKIGGKWAGIVAVVIGGFSLPLVFSSRWLSNPTPMFLISMLFVYSTFLVLEGRKWGWALAAFMAAMAMQFGSAAEIFYFLGILAFGVYIFLTDKKKLPNFKMLLLSILLIVITFAPQVLFDLRHEGILRGTLSRFLTEGSFKLSFWEIAKIRLPFYYDVFFSKIFPSSTLGKGATALVLLGVATFSLNKIVKENRLIVLFFLLLSPVLGMLFFQGNYGNVYDYYFTGYYLIFILLFASMVGLAAKRPLGRLFIIVFLLLFIKNNVPSLRDYLVSSVDRETAITLGNQLQAVNWVFDDALKEKERFNVDVYVPPVIPHAYDYLFLWQGTEKCGVTRCGQELNNQVPILYTLYEVDPPHPERLEAWLERQKTVGQVVDEQRFGGIVVQRRARR